MIVTVNKRFKNLSNKPSINKAGFIGFMSWDSIVKILEEKEGLKIKELQLEDGGIQMVFE